MLDVLTVLAIVVVGVTVLAAVIYIAGFLVSMLITLFTGPADALTHHHHHPVTG